MIETVDGLHLCVQRTAGNKPHDQLDAFGARFTHVFDVRNFREPDRVVDEAVEEAVVPFLVDEASARPLQLVAHAAGAPDLHIQVFVEAFHGLANGATQRQAASARWHGIQHHVHGHRNDLHWPGFGLAEHDRQRHGETVVHVHLVDDGEVEVLLDDRVCNMRSEGGMAFHYGHRTRTPAFIGRLEAGGATNGKRGNDVEAESGGVVVVDQNDHVRLLLGYPFLALGIAGEDLLPVRFVRLAVVQCCTDGGHMAGGDGSSDTGHYFFSPT